jgi:cation transport ATPase
VERLDGSSLRGTKEVSDEANQTTNGLLRSARNDNWLQILASLEATSTHPIAHAIIQYAENHNIQLLPVQNATNHAGKGIS